MDHTGIKGTEIRIIRELIQQVGFRLSLSVFHQDLIFSPFVIPFNSDNKLIMTESVTLL